ncbi:hypothetical protein ANCCAN_15026 [Ancylostoma caninum]|uniref:CWH43-like N-terminal domain-containing protein n=1 Tax=Ancylostoma caninum TaxID=29170 RepID=A0A368G7U9_ANCCA|nr:hypothetical protein ANCCAN_15026 [Ancylostoma caninum]
MLRLSTTIFTISTAIKAFSITFKGERVGKSSLGEECGGLVRREQRRKRLQLVFLASVTTTIPVIFVFFILYNVYCIPTTYELFAIFEYATVAGIYGFHVTSFWRMTGYIHVYHSNLKMHSVRV